MKLAFSTRDVTLRSFAGLCAMAGDYGMDGFEIWDAVAERKSHSDSVLRNETLSEAKILMMNNNVEVSALNYPQALESEQATGNALVQYVDMAAVAGIENVIVHVDSIPDTRMLYAKYQDKGYTSTETYHYTNERTGEPGTQCWTKWTQKGRLFLYETLKAEGILPTIEKDAA